MNITYITRKDEITGTPPRHSLEDSFISGDIRYRKYFAENLLTTRRGGSDCSIVAYAFAEDISYLEAMLRMATFYKKDSGTDRQALRRFLSAHGYHESKFLFKITLLELWNTGFFLDGMIVYLNLYDPQQNVYHGLAFRRHFFGDFLPEKHVVQSAYIKTNK